MKNAKKIFIPIICIMAVIIAVLIGVIVFATTTPDIGDAVTSSVSSNIKGVSFDKKHIFIKTIEHLRKDDTENISDEIEVREETKDNNSEKPDRGNCDFRNAKWGDSIETIKEYAYDLTFTEESDVGLMAETVVCGYNAYVIYQFDDNKLYGGVYLFNIGSTKGGRYIAAYNTVKDALIEKYDKPIEDVIAPMTNQNLINVADDATALELGYVVYVARWETENNNITLSMFEQNYEIMFTLVYTDKTYESDTSNGL